MLQLLNVCECEFCHEKLFPLFKLLKIWSYPDCCPPWRSAPSWVASCILSWRAICRVGSQLTRISLTVIEYGFVTKETFQCLTNVRSIKRVRCSGGTRAGAPTPLIFRPNWAPKGRKKKFGDRPPPLSQGLNDRPPPLSYLNVWIRHWDVHRMTQNIIQCTSAWLLH